MQVCSAVFLHPSRSHYATFWVWSSTVKAPVFSATCRQPMEASLCARRSISLCLFVARKFNTRVNSWLSRMHLATTTVKLMEGEERWDLLMGGGGGGGNGKWCSGWVQGTYLSSPPSCFQPASLSLSLSPLHQQLHLCVCVCVSYLNPHRATSHS